ncbi:hypothetical protein GXW83_22285 [Streptacidiphilus sp. PB12-B1b]|uniref:hypothetical protein n=1 Tax=Streptacidiphilus sp. PB12-B1b TaxID=2705012 RepID=UPI0015FE6004|nr:hypothetical protein [Streptacidiphilus sp. PB12-B1b]QMU78018.1 hypothetical protein GXW83_22285 [Streptacidiphilus sp. PB12-B1b]
MKQQLIPLVPLLKELVAGPRLPAGEAGEDSPARLAHVARSQDLARLDEELVPLVFQNVVDWFQQEDDWVAECLAVWVDPEAGRLIVSSLRDDAGQGELELFVDAFGPVVERWRAEEEQARPQPNPDHDPADPVEGTQYRRYARLPGSDEFQWLYGSGPDAADWQTIEDRYRQHEADADGGQAESVRPYEDHFIKLVDGRWVFGASPDAAVWYDDYDQLLAQEGPVTAGHEADADGGQAESVRPYEDHFIKLVDGRWVFGASPDAAVWYDDYDQLLAQEGPVTAETEPPAQTGMLLDAVSGGLDQRVFQPDADLSAEEAESLLESPAGQMFFQVLAQTMIDTQAPQFDSLLQASEDFSEQELSDLLRLVQAYQD